MEVGLLDLVDSPGPEGYVSNIVSEIVLGFLVCLH